jgi:hypothetical protein
MVLAGYALSFLVAYAACDILGRIRRDPGSGGMQAFGDFLGFVGLFGFLALLPTALALYRWRRSARFWTVFSASCLLLAVAGPIAALTLGRPYQALSAFVGLFGLLIVLGAPLLGLGFLVSGIIAPLRRSRRVLFAAAAIEFVVSGYAFVCLFLVKHWLL